MKLDKLLILILLFVPSAIFGSTTAFASDTLTIKQKSIILIAAWTAKGDLSSLDRALEKGLESGLTVNEIKEELIHLSAYCGFPRSLNGINTFSTVVERRKSKGIKDVVGKKPAQVPQKGKYEAGKNVLQSLTGRTETGPKSGYAAFVPAIDTLLKEHLFNDIFSRGVLDYKERELTTVSALVTLGGVESQLSGHMNICVQIGISAKQLEELLSLIGNTLGTAHTKEGRKVLERITAREK